MKHKGRQLHTAKRDPGFAVRLFEGAIIGAGGILPGVSGGILCVMFGLYRPLMELLANPIRGIKQHFRLLLPVGIGIAGGFFGLTRLLEWLFQANRSVAAALFAGLILGMFPSLWKEAGKKGRTNASLVFMAVAFCVVFFFFLYLHHVPSLSIVPDWKWYIFCGVVLGVGIILPGMSASSILIFLGLYEPMLNAVNTFALESLLPLAAGALAAIALLSRGISRLFDQHYSMVFHIIMGVVAATTLPTIPLRFQNGAQAASAFAALAAGIAAAWFLRKISETYSVETD